ncbi:MAG: ComF family protein [Gammaproteobacteria bacterium]|jgi:ComF family protein
MRIRDRLLDVLYPPRCLVCGQGGVPGRDLCLACAAELPWQGHACTHCALPLPAGSSERCGRCQRRRPAFDSARAVFEYRPPLDSLLPRLKYGARLSHGRLLGQLMAERLAPGLEMRPDCVLPVPLHRRRLTERGFNQALELARPVARALGVPLAMDGVRRVRSTPPQVGLAAKARRANLRGAFELRSGFRPAHVLIVDDVMTTGATVDELARVLKRAGVRRVDVWACARAAPGK